MQLLKLSSLGMLVAAILLFLAAYLIDPNAVERRVRHIADAGQK